MQNNIWELYEEASLRQLIINSYEEQIAKVRSVSKWDKHKYPSEQELLRRMEEELEALETSEQDSQVIRVPVRQKRLIVKETIKYLQVRTFVVREEKSFHQAVLKGNEELMEFLTEYKRWSDHLKRRVASLRKTAPSAKNLLD